MRNEYMELIVSKFGEPTQQYPAAEQTVEKYRAIFPKNIIEIWQSEGFCQFMQGLYYFTNPDDWQPVVDAWLKNDGAPVPKQIADKLSGRYYKNFDEFRKDFWKEVAKDPVLSKQFTKGNLITMSKGNAPAAPLSEQVGGRIKFELDHNHEIQDGGLVYDLGNIIIRTPKDHIAKTRDELQNR